MKLSIVVIFHNMQREAQRTLYSLSTAYQADVSAIEYEVIAIDNGSAQPLEGESIDYFGPNFRYLFLDTDSVSPVGAVNLGVEMAQAENVAVIVDGARMATPGLVGNSVQALQLFAEPFIYSLAWHLGPDIQNRSMLKGYDQSEEDRLLASVAWQTNGYQLFEISTLAPSSGRGFLGGVPPECSWFAMRKTTFVNVGGFDPRFTSPGGGLVNQDFRNSIMQHPGIRPVLLLGEGVFHQFHGGVATNVERKHHPMQQFKAAYREIKGMDYESVSAPRPFYFGALPEAAVPFLGKPPP